MGMPSSGASARAFGERGVALLAIALAARRCSCGFWRLSRGTWGAAMRAVRDRETAAESVGLEPAGDQDASPSRSRRPAPALAGGLFAPLSGFVTPLTFAFLQSILFVLVVMIGGAGTSPGRWSAPRSSVLLPELLSGLEEYRLLFFGALLLVVLWVAPDGIVGAVRRGCRRRRRRCRRSPCAGRRCRCRHDGAAQRARTSHGLTIAFGGVQRGRPTCRFDRARRARSPA